MGSDFVALFDRRVGRGDVPHLIHGLNALNPQIAEWWPSALPDYRIRFNPVSDEPWRIADPPGDGTRLSGSRGLTLHLAPAAVLFWGPRWGEFVACERSRTFTRRLCGAFAHLLDTGRSVYVPDAYYPSSPAYEQVVCGATLRQAEEWLLRECGPPATIGSCVAESKATYFADDFSDLGSGDAAGR